MDGTYDDDSCARWVAEPPKRAGRSAFERDRARVLHSAALRRLAAKTQIHGPGTDDFVRNRLTHSLEVAQVGREVAKALGCDPDVVDTACLAHDLGHPPFGHNGEVALDVFAATCGGFEGNAQTLRVLTRLEAKVFGPDHEPVGLNLTRASLDAASKYPWPRPDVPPLSRTAATADDAVVVAGPPVKYGVYADDAAAFDWMRRGAPPRRRCIEAQVMDFADDVAYSVHDVEDGIQALEIDPAALSAPGERPLLFDMVRQAYLPTAGDTELAEALDRLLALPVWPRSHDGTRAALARLKDLASQLIGRFCAAVEDATRDAHGRAPLVRHSADLVVPADVRLEIVVLKGIAARYVMFTPARTAMLQVERALMSELADLVLAGAPRTLEPSLRDDWSGAPDDTARRRVIVDQVASLTDPSARALHARLSGRR